MLFGTSGKMVKKTKLIDADKQRLKVLRNKLIEKIYRLKTEIVYQKLSKTVEMWKYRSYRRERLLDKYLVSLRYKKPKRPKGLGWKDDA